MSAAAVGSAASPRISVCICTRDRTVDLTRALASIAASSVAPAQVVVSDDGADGSAAAVADAAAIAVDYVRGPGTGLGANRNRAIAAATGDYLLFLDDDAELGGEFLARVAAVIGTVPASARRRTIVTGAELNRGSVVTPNEQDLLGFQSRPYRPGESLKTVVINAAIFPRALFGEIGFDPLLRYGCDEVDVSTQAVARGYSILPCFEATNLHSPSPVGRESYDAAANVARLYVTLKRRRLTERSPLRGWSGFALAAGHTCLAAIRREGPRRGGADAARTIATALEYYSTHSSRAAASGEAT